MFRALFCCLANSLIALWACTKSHKKTPGKITKSGRFLLREEEGLGQGWIFVQTNLKPWNLGYSETVWRALRKIFNCLQTIYQRHSIAPKLYNAKSSICGPTFKFCSWQSSVRIYYTNMRSLLGLNFWMWMSQNEVANDNGMQRVGRETNIAQGQYCNIALGNIGFHLH